jgi:hypothetical protein
MKKNYSCQVLNIHRVNNVSQTEIHTAEPLVPKPGSLDDEVANEKLERYKSSDTDQILAELIQTGGNTQCPALHFFIPFGIRKYNSSSERNLLLHLFTRRATELTLVIIEEHHCYTKFYPTYFPQS